MGSPAAKSLLGSCSSLVHLFPMCLGTGWGADEVAPQGCQPTEELTRPASSGRGEPHAAAKDGTGRKSRGCLRRGRAGAHTEKLESHQYILRVDCGPWARQASSHRSGREAGSLPRPRLIEGGPLPSPLVEGAAPGLPPDSGLSIPQKNDVFQPTGREDLPTTSVPSGSRSVENGAVSPTLAQPTQRHISNPHCAGTHPPQVLLEMQCPGVALQPTQPASHSSLGSGAPLGGWCPTQMGGNTEGQAEPGW